MADISITAANVIAGETSLREAGVAGAAVTAGQVVYKDATTRKFLLTDADSVTAAARVPYGVALNGAATNQPLAVLRSGEITIGATLTPGTAYYLSDDPGGICPLADVTGGDYIVQIGLARSASVLMVDFQVTGVAS